LKLHLKLLLTLIWTLDRLVPIEVHYMEKNPGMFASKTFISFRLRKQREISEELLWQQALSLLIQTFCLSLNKFIQPRLKQMTSKRQQQPRHNVTAVSSRAFCSLCYKFSAGRYCALKTDSPGVKNRRDLEQPKKKEERIRLQSSGSHVSDWLHMGDPLNFHLFGGSNRSSDSQ